MNQESPDFIEMDNFYLDVLNMPQKQWAPEDIIKYVYDKPAGIYSRGHSDILQYKHHPGGDDNRSCNGR
jgi:hypothetical protein